MIDEEIDYDDSDYDGGYYAYFMQQGYPPHHYYEVEPHIIDEHPEWSSYEKYWIDDEFTVEDALADLNGLSE